MLGWIVNNAIWDVLNTTMIAGVPFLVLIVREWYTARREGDDEGDKGLLTLNRIETSLYAMFVVYLFAAAPLFKITFLPVNVNQVHLDKCGVRVITGTSGAYSGTLGGQHVYMPPWWAMVHAISHGLTNAALASLPCQTDYVYMRSELKLTTITDPLLRREISRFKTACYGGARWQLFQWLNTIPPDLARDVSWIGSKFFLTTPGFYDSIQANRPVSGFPFDPGRDWGYSTLPSKGGYPTCKDWWLSPGNGLKDRLLHQIDPNLLHRFQAVFSGQPVEEVLVRSLIKSYRTSAIGNAEDGVIAGGAEYNGWISRVFGDIMGYSGAKLGYLPAQSMKSVASRALPMAQKLILMTMVMVLPFLIVISGYSAQVVGVITFSYFGVTFLTFWFQLSRWLSNHLIEIVFQSPAGTLQSAAGLSGSYDQAVLGIVQVFMLFVFPALWLAMLGWAGAGIGKGVGDALQGGIGGAVKAGQKAGETVQGLATKIRPK